MVAVPPETVAASGSERVVARRTKAERVPVAMAVRST